MGVEPPLGVGFVGSVVVVVVVVVVVGGVMC